MDAEAQELAEQALAAEGLDPAQVAALLAGIEGPDRQPVQLASLPRDGRAPWPRIDPMPWDWLAAVLGWVQAREPLVRVATADADPMAFPWRSLAGRRCVVATRNMGAWSLALQSARRWRLGLVVVAPAAQLPERAILAEWDVVVAAPTGRSQADAWLAWALAQDGVALIAIPEHFDPMAAELAAACPGMGLWP